MYGSFCRPVSGGSATGVGPVSQIKRVGDHTSTPLLGGAVANDEPASLRFQLVFLHVVDHEDCYWCLLSNLFLDRFKN
jgi:hypothetical protein